MIAIFLLLLLLLLLFDLDYLKTCALRLLNVIILRHMFSSSLNRITIITEIYRPGSYQVSDIERNQMSCVGPRIIHTVLLAFYHEWRSLIGYATHYLFFDRLNFERLVDLY